MITIEKSPYQYSQQKGLGQAALAEQAWLSVMEQSGLAEALKNTQLIMAGDGNSFGSSSKMETNPRTTSQQKSEFANAIAKNVRGIPEATLRQFSNNSLLSLFRLEVAQESTMLPNVSVATTRSVADTKLLETLKSMKGFDSMVRYQEWSLRNMMVLRSEQGVEVWIRDANLAGNKLQQILKNIRESMGSLGASLVMVVVNGKSIFSETTPVQRALKEQGNGS